MSLVRLAPVLAVLSAAPALAQAPPAPALSAAETAALSKLARLKLSGYVQGRYEYHEDADYGLGPDRRPRGTTRFMVRRARLKVVHAGENSEYVFQLAGGPDGLTFSDAEATFVDTWTPLKLRVTVGQFKLPFGFELLQSSSEREVPERARVVTTFFPGERDRGLRIGASLGVFRFVGALVNGNGVRDPIYTTFDQTSWKDLVGRFSAELGRLSAGVSGYWGHTLRTRVPESATAPVTYERYSRLRAGGDTQLRLPVPVLGELHLRGELLWGRDENISFGGVPGQSCRDVESLGWLVTVVQYVGEKVAIAARVDQFDPNRGVAASCPERAAADSDRVTTLSAALLYLVSSNLRAMLAYDAIDQQEGRERADDILTVQLQARF